MQQFLLDTQIALWIMTGSSRFNEQKFREITLNQPSRVIFHQVSTWEIQIKYQLGKLPLPQRPEEIIPKAVTNSGFDYEKIDDRGIFLLDKLPNLHSDPFDRLLITHALLNGWTIITTDENIQKYPVSTLKIN